MKVLLVDPAARGGIARYTSVLVQALDEAGIDTVSLASRSLDEDGRPGSVLRLLPDLPASPPTDWLHSARRALDWLTAARAVASTAARTRPDVVHFQFSLNRRFDPILLRLLRRAGLPVIWTAHDIVPFGFRDADRTRFAAIYRASDLVIVHTEPAQAGVQAMGATRVRVIPHPAAARHAPSSREEARRRLGLPGPSRVMAALGFIREYKGYDLLADTWERLGRDAPLLLVMGEATDSRGLAALTRLEGIGRTDVRRGYASDDDLETAARSADALLLPHARASDSGMVHLGRAVGTPVIASDAPELAASVHATGAGFVVRRDAAEWARVVTGPLPPAPPPPPPLADTAQEHADAYREALTRPVRR